MSSIQHALRLPGASPTQELTRPAGDLIQPSTRNNDAGDGIHEPNKQGHEGCPLLADHQQDRLDVVLEEDPGDEEGAFGQLVGLGGRGVLVREDEVLVAGVGLLRGRGAGEEVEGARALGVDGGDDGEEVLELVVVGFGGGDGLVEGVVEGGIVRAEGEFGDHVREVEGWRRRGWVSFVSSRGDIRMNGREHTSMIQMRRKVPISMASSSDVEIPLYLVALQAPVDAA